MYLILPEGDSGEVDYAQVTFQDRYPLFHLAFGNKQWKHVVYRMQVCFCYCFLSLAATMYDSMRIFHCNQCYFMLHQLFNLDDPMFHGPFFDCARTIHCE